MINNVRHIRFVEGVLGLKLSIQDTCLLLEGGIPYNQKQIVLETQIYEGFLDDLAAKIGGVPKTIAKTFTDGVSVLTFIYNVISDKTGENLSKAIKIITRNCSAMFAKISRAAENLPGKLKELFTKVIDWIKTKTKSVLSIQSDTDATDNIKGDGGNWKKFIGLLLVGMILVFLKQIPDVLKSFGEDVVSDGLDKIWTATQDLLAKFLASPAELIKLVTGGGLIKALLPLLALYKSAKMLQSINSDLVDSNAWLKKESKLLKHSLI